MPDHNAHDDSDPADTFDPARHLISDRELDQIALGLDFAEAALRGPVPDVDPPARESARQASPARRAA